MNLFNLENNKVTFTPEALTIKEFKALWDRDVSKTKENAVEDLAYVFFVTDYKSVYKAYDDEARSEKVIKDVITQKKWTRDKAIEAAIARYDELQQTPSMGVLQDAEAALSKIRHYFRNVDVSDDETGKATSALINNVKAIGDLLKGLQSLRELVEKEINETTRVRGQGRLGMRETPRK